MLLRLIFFCCCLFLGAALWAQNERDEGAMISTDKGFSVAEDSVFLLNIRFRMQNRVGLRSPQEQLPEITEIDARVRRLRLRFDGFVGSRALQYYIQLSFSRSDVDFDNSGETRIVRDAMVYYQFSPSFYMGFGQSKLPGNRQRVTSSGNIQFADRSVANNQFTIDRDYGFFAYYKQALGASVVNLKGALSAGEGRNINRTDNGLAYTLRGEWLPFGSFANSGDYSEGDLEWEERPKLSLATTFSYNHKTTNSGGQIGQPLPSGINLRSWIADAAFKYQGHGVVAEYFWRASSTASLTDPLLGTLHIPIGRGLNAQYSYTFPSFWAGMLRYSRVDREDAAALRNQEEILLGFNKFFNGHRIKIQSHLGYQRNFDEANQRAFWVAMFQVEFGI